MYIFLGILSFILGAVALVFGAAMGSSYGIKDMKTTKAVAAALLIASPLLGLGGITFIVLFFVL